MYKYTSRTWTQEVMGTEGLAGAGSRGRSGERSGGGGWSEGERAGVDKFVFVLSTHESAHGEALYGVCIYWDEPCYLLLPDAEEGKTGFSLLGDSEPDTPTNTPHSLELPSAPPRTRGGRGGW